jgi:hypothetical protein
MIIASFTVENKSPIIIKERRVKGNFYEGLDYIPASTLIGAIATGMLEENCPIYDGIHSVDCSKCGKSNCKFNIWINEGMYPWLSHGYITSVEKADPLIPLNPPMLETIGVTVNENGEEEFCDLLPYKLASKALLSIKPDVTSQPFRNKPPKYWEVRNGKICRIKVETMAYTHIAIDPITRSSYLTKIEKETTGLLFTLKTIKPKQKFMFKALCNDEDYEVIRDILHRGVWIGMGKSRGYGYIKLLFSSMTEKNNYKEKRVDEIEKISDKVKEILKDLGLSLNNHIIIIDGVTHTSRQLEEMIRGKVMYRNYHTSDLIIYRLGNIIKIRNLLRPGFVFVLESKSLNNYADLELSPPKNDRARWAGSGWLQINHPVHTLWVKR